MDEERMQILRMLEGGKVTAEEAARLLDAVGKAGPGRGPQQRKVLRIKVTDPATNKHKVNLTLPVGLAKIAAKFIPSDAKAKMMEEGIDIDHVMSQVLSENAGKVVDIMSDEGKVEISLE